MTDVIYRSKGALIEFISNNLVNLSASNNISASAFYGDGSNLTDVTASAVQVADGPEYSLQFRLDSPISGEISGSSNLMYLGGSPDLLQLTGNFHIQVGDGNAAAAAGGSDDLIISSDDNAGITILTSDNKYSQIYFGSPTDNVAAGWSHSYNQGSSTIGTYVSGHEFKLVSGNGSIALTLDENQHVTASGVLVVEENLLVEGNTTLGDASGDSVTINAQTIDIPNVTTGTDNTVLVYNNSSIVTDEINPSVWDTSATFVEASGTPVDNQLGVWDSADTLEGDSNLTWNGSTLDVGGALTVDGNTTLGDASGDSVTINAQTIDLANVDEGTDNTVLVYNGSSIVTDEIDSRVWGSTLVDGTNGTDNEIAIFTDSNSVEGVTSLTFDGSTLTVTGDASITGDTTIGGDVTLTGGGFVSALGAPISGTDRSAANEWVKVAEYSSGVASYYATAVIDVILAGHDGTAEIFQARVHLRAQTITTAYSTCQVDIIQDAGSEAWDTTDFILTQKTTSTYEGELWVRSGASNQQCYATITNGTTTGDSAYKTDWHLTPGQTWGSYATAGTDVTTTNVKKRFDSLVIDGDLTLSGQPAVCAVLTSNQAIGSSLTKIIFDSVTAPASAGSLFNVGGDYNTSTGIFTAPTDGKYLISVSALIEDAVVSGAIVLSCVTTKSTAGTDYFQANYYNGGVLDEDGYLPLQGTWLANIDQNDQAYINVQCSAGTGATEVWGHVNYWHTRLNIIKVA